jgi:hypothetical protein
VTDVAIVADVASAPASAPMNATAAATAPGGAWEAASPNALSFELLGNGLLYSVSYERVFPAYNLGLRGGASFFRYKISAATGSGNLTLASLPLVASYYFGPPRHKLQLGLGATVLYVDAASDASGVKFQGSGTGFDVAATAVIGYRFVPRGTGPMFSIGFTPLLRAAKGFLPWGGASGGVEF